MKARNQLDYFLQNTLSLVLAQGNGVDQKANILLATNFVVLGVLGGRVKTDPHDWAVYAGILSFLGSAFFALLAVMPRAKTSSSGVGAKSLNRDLEDNLVFEAAAKLHLSEFQKEMVATMRSEQTVYLATLKNIHQMSCIVGLKFRLARMSYQLLFAGIVLYIICTLVQHHGSSLLPL
jgi:hypothetical protein